ncbi:MAG TPA: transketolase C-terminal domain-containing protein [Patescibacteria group bacterium]|nr:transketolase C-terminal domain-containing protein [Patescibacteria group bacterium]
MCALLNPHLSSKDVEQVPTRNGYGDGLLELGVKDPRVVVLTGDLSESTRVNGFQKKFPERFIECGVAEQNMMGIAAGLALSGKIPFVSSYAVFVPGRAWDQLRVSVCYSNANVKVAGAHAGISVGPDGATHQALEDLATVRVLPNLTVVAPCDYLETKKATIAIGTVKGPAYLRFSREKTPIITRAASPFRIGRHEIFEPGKDVTIAACGPLIYEAMLAARDLRKYQIHAEVINCHTLKPFDHQTLIKSVKKTGCCVTVEEHQMIGGLYGAVSETLGQHFPVPIEPVGMPDSFGESGEPRELLEKYHMTAFDIVLAAKKAIRRKR